jgi:hypothetical protein
MFLRHTLQPAEFALELYKVGIAHEHSLEGCMLNRRDLQSGLDGRIFGQHVPVL